MKSKLNKILNIIFFTFSIILFQACQPIQTRLSFDTNGGNDIESITIKDIEELYNLPVPEREGYLFMGWYLEDLFETRVEYSIFDFMMSQEQITIYAKWDIQTFTLTVFQYRDLFNTLFQTQDRIVDVALGEKHSLILTEKGRVFSWGSNQYGQLGLLDIEDRRNPVESTLNFELNVDEKIIKIEAGWNHSSALTSHGRLLMWGRNDQGQLGDGTTNDKSIPIDVTKQLKLSPNESIESIALGWGHSGVLTSNGRLLMWGRNESGQLGDGTTMKRLDPVDITSGIIGFSDETIQAVDLGSSHTGIITSSGRLLMWGRNVYGQLGDGTTQSKRSPTDITGNLTLSKDEKIETLSLGWGHSSIVTSNQQIFIWGFNQFGQLGNQSMIDSLTPQNISSNYALFDRETIQQLTIRNGQSAFITSSQRMFIWGLNRYGQLGNNSQLNQDKPINQVIDLLDNETIVTLELGIQHSALLTSRGRLFMWGSNQHGQLGDGTSQERDYILIRPIHYLYASDVISVNSPYTVYSVYDEGLTWYDSVIFKEEVIFPKILNENLTIYGMIDD